MSCYLCCTQIKEENTSSEDDRLFCCDLHASYYKPEGHQQTLPWTIASDPQFGRYLVASRNIGPGDCHFLYSSKYYLYFIYIRRVGAARIMFGVGT